MSKIKMALSDDNIDTYIENVDKSDGKKYYCYTCGGELIAKQGKVKDWHFAHKGKTNCNGETWIHKNGIRLMEDAIFKKNGFDIEIMENEYRMESNGVIIRPDIYVKINNGLEFIVEVHYTNKKSDEWIKKVRDNFENIAYVFEVSVNSWTNKYNIVDKMCKIFDRYEYYKMVDKAYSEYKRDSEIGLNKINMTYFEYKWIYDCNYARAFEGEGKDYKSASKSMDVFNEHIDSIRDIHNTIYYNALNKRGTEIRYKSIYNEDNKEIGLNALNVLINAYKEDICDYMEENIIKVNRYNTMIIHNKLKDIDVRFNRSKINLLIKNAINKYVYSNRDISFHNKGNYIEYDNVKIVESDDITKIDKCYNILVDTILEISIRVVDILFLKYNVKTYQF